MEEQVLQQIEDTHKKSNGKCGIAITTIQNSLQVSYKTLRPILEKLYKEKIIIIRKGINGKLIFKNGNLTQHRKQTKNN